MEPKQLLKDAENMLNMLHEGPTDNKELIAVAIANALIAIGQTQMVIADEMIKARVAGKSVVVLASPLIDE